MHQVWVLYSGGKNTPLSENQTGDLSYSFHSVVGKGCKAILHLSVTSMMIKNLLRNRIFR
jgi:hypothetical protein